MTKSLSLSCIMFLFRCEISSLHRALLYDVSDWRNRFRVCVAAVRSSSSLHWPGYDPRYDLVVKSVRKSLCGWHGWRQQLVSCLLQTKVTGSKSENSFADGAAAAGDTPPGSQGNTASNPTSTASTPTGTGAQPSQSTPQQQVPM